MRIIKAGSSEPNVVVFTCTKCGCKFEAVANLEAKLVFDQRDGNYWQCQCPQKGCDKTCTKSA